MTLQEYSLQLADKCRTLSERIAALLLVSNWNPTRTGKEEKVIAEIEDLTEEFAGRYFPRLRANLATQDNEHLLAAHEKLKLGISGSLFGGHPEENPLQLWAAQLRVIAKDLEFVAELVSAPHLSTISNTFSDSTIGAFSVGNTSTATGFVKKETKG